MQHSALSQSAQRQRMPLLKGALAVFVFLSAIYLLSIDIRASYGASITGDEPFYLVTTQSLLNDGDLDLSNQFSRSTYSSFFDHADGLWMQSRNVPGKPLLSPHNPGLSIFLIPGFYFGELLGSQIQMVLIAGATFALAFVIVSKLTGRWFSTFWLTFALGITAPSFIYSSEIYPEIPASFFLLLVLLILTNSRRVGALKALTLTVLISLLPWLGVKYAVIAFMLVCCTFYLCKPKENWLFACFSTISLLAYVYFHLSTFGGLTPYNVNIVYEDMSSSKIFVEHFVFSDRVYRIWGLFIDQRFGLFRWAPVLLICIAGIPLMLRSKFIGKLMFALFCTQIFIASFVVITMMGWWFPGRTLITCIPLLLAPLVFVWTIAPVPFRILIILLITHSVFITIALTIAGYNRDVVVAVNPYELEALVFSATQLLFPDYTSWDFHTWITTTIWMLLFTGVAVISKRMLVAFRYHFGTKFKHEL